MNQDSTNTTQNSANTHNANTNNTISTGFKLIDEMLDGGFRKGELIVIAAHSGMGKTSLALTMVKNALAMTDIHITLFCLETTAERYIRRLIAMDTGINSQKFYTGELSQEEWVVMQRAADLLSQKPLRLDDAPATMARICTYARQACAKGELEMLVIDVIQLVRVAGLVHSLSPEQEMRYFVDAFRKLADELNIPIIIVSQLELVGKDRADKRPILADLQHVGRLDRKADIVMFIYREEHYIADTDHKNLADIIIAKNPNGMTGSVCLFFEKNLTRFSDLTTRRVPISHRPPGEREDLEGFSEGSGHIGKASPGLVHICEAMCFVSNLTTPKTI
ncbi:MAG: DnaB-like helicase C-terminal domain-containing protein [Chloroflexota bacterium]